MNIPRPSCGVLVRVFSLLALGGIIFVLFSVYGVGDAASEVWMDQHVRSQGAKGVLVYVGLVALLTGVGVPRQLCSALGGYVFGAWLGTLWATLGTGIACCLCFSYARFLGQAWLHRRYGDKVGSFNDFICQSPFMLTVMVRIVPLGSNFLTNLLAGVSRIPALPFLGGSVVGFTIQNLIFAMLGSGLQAGVGWNTAVSAVLYAVSLGIGYTVYRQYKTHRVRRNDCPGALHDGVMESRSYKK